MAAYALNYADTSWDCRLMRVCVHVRGCIRVYVCVAEATCALIASNSYEILIANVEITKPVRRPKTKDKQEESDRQTTERETGRESAGAAW